MKAFSSEHSIPDSTMFRHRGGAAGRFIVAMRVVFSNTIAELRLIVSLLFSIYREKGKKSRLFRLYRKYVALFISYLSPWKPHALLAFILGVVMGIKSYDSVKMWLSCRSLRTRMNRAVKFEDWKQAEKELETASPQRDDSQLYDVELVKSKLKELQDRQRHGDLHDIMFYLRADLVRNMGNMCNPALHKGRLSVPKLINDYIFEVEQHLRLVCDSGDEEGISVEEKLVFMHETRHAFGRTALLLSGGAALGNFHVGVVKTLIEENLLPRIVAGSSAGSIACAIVATRTEAELREFFGSTSFPLKFFDEGNADMRNIIRRLFTQGTAHDSHTMKKMLKDLTSNMTFQEAYEKTGRVLGVSVCSPRRLEPPRFLNYLNSPRALIWSAVTASCAFPFLFEAQRLKAKNRYGEILDYHPPFNDDQEAVSSRNSASSGISRLWIDGSLQIDLPMNHLRELFGVNHFIVSQVNPHIAPLLQIKDFSRAVGGNFSGKLARLMEMELKHRCNQLLELGYSIGGFVKLFSQEWEGDITVVVPASPCQLMKLIQNTTDADLQRAIDKGRRCAWEKLPAIFANCHIERVLDDCICILNDKRRGHSTGLLQHSGYAFNVCFINSSRCSEHDDDGPSDTDSLSDCLERRSLSWATNTPSLQS